MPNYALKKHFTMSAVADAANPSAATEHTGEPQSAGHSGTHAVSDYGNATEHVDAGPSSDQREGAHSSAQEHRGGSMGSQYPCTFTLRWALTGELIKHCTEMHDVRVEQLCQHLDEGIYEEYGVPRSDASFLS